MLQVLLDGVDLRRLQLQFLRSHLSLVSQEPTLFATTIAANILYAKPGGLACTWKPALICFRPWQARCNIHNCTSWSHGTKLPERLLSPGSWILARVYMYYLLNSLAS